MSFLLYIYSYSTKNVFKIKKLLKTLYKLCVCVFMCVGIKIGDSASLTTWIAHRSSPD